MLGSNSKHIAQADVEKLYDVIVLDILTLCCVCACACVCFWYVQYCILNPLIIII